MHEPPPGVQHLHLNHLITLSPNIPKPPKHAEAKAVLYSICWLLIRPQKNEGERMTSFYDRFTKPKQSKRAPGPIRWAHIFSEGLSDGYIMLLPETGLGMIHIARAQRA